MRRLRFGRLAAAVLMVAASLLPTVYLDKKYELGAQTIRVKPYEKRDDTPYIKIGVYASLTGYASLLGRMGQQGIRLAVEDINGSGGVDGKEIRLIEYDDQSDSEAAVTAVRKMIEEDRVDAIIGSHTSGNILQTTELTEQAHVVQIGLGTSFVWTGVGTNTCSAPQQARSILMSCC